MSEWAMRRFWKNASVVDTDRGFTVELDGKSVRTPSKALLEVPTERIAERIADEWHAQDDRVDPRRMPWTRSANSAIDKVAPFRAAVEAHLAEYAGTDLLCYRAEEPGELVARQTAAWDPILSETQEAYGVALTLASGVMPVAQAEASIARLAAQMSDLNDFELTGFHDLVTLSGSFLLALAFLRGQHEVQDLWAWSRVDETWQFEQWGHDEEADALAASKFEDFKHAAAFLSAAT